VTAGASNLYLGSAGQGVVSRATVVVTNDGGSTLDCTFGIMGSGYSVGPESATLKPGGSVTLTVTLDRTFLDPANYLGVVVVTGKQNGQQFGIQANGDVT
jgi:hypothetical protein